VSGIAYLKPRSATQELTMLATFLIWRFFFRPYIALLVIDPLSA
jgi:hypothetical protein